jgi:IS5 family transposase
MMDYLIPWDEWAELVKPVYFEGKRGRKPRGIETMLRMYFLQIWFSLSDAAVEDSIYDSYAMRTFMKIDFTKEQAPDATTLLKFRHKIEDAGLGKTFFDAQNKFFVENGYIMKGGQWYFGCKLHHGVDAGTGLIHSVTATAANISDIDETSKLIREDDEVVYGDSGYMGIEKRPEIMGDENLKHINFIINRRRGELRKLDPIAKGWEMHIENRKSATRCKVEHTFLIIKRDFGFKKVRYRGLAKTLNQWYMAALSANLVMLGRAGRVVAPLTA